MAETSYQVLARKWRPQAFAELAGLEHIARTLQNAIRRDRVGHAFMFTGSRGVGKTSAARILAKALNCAEGPAPEPCNRCDNCRAITAGTAPDVIEIDGASNRGVGEIRLLREGVSYLPQAAPYKIYIIDEVHMLTTEAFNALLKTLEEPPAHVKFIMATTDVHKVPTTILSRCQRFDFGRLSQATIAAALEEVGGREGLVFEPGTVDLLAREARGSMRDALSLLDQVSAYAGGEIKTEDLRAALGLIEARHCQQLLAAIVAGDLAAAVGQIGALEQGGSDLKDFAREFLFFLRDALFIKLSGRLEKLLGISPDEAAELKPLVDSRELPYWQQLFTLWQERYSGIYIAQIPRLALEMAVVELGMARDLKPLDELLERLERGLATGSGAAAAPAGASKRVSPNPVKKSTEQTEKSDSAAPSTALSGARPRNREPADMPPPAPPEAEPASGPPEDLPPWKVPGGRPAMVREKEPGGRAVNDEQAAAVGGGSLDGTETPQPENGRPTAQDRTPGRNEASPAAAVPEGGEGLTASRWKDFLAYLARHDRRLGAMLQGSRFVVLEPEGCLKVEAAPYALVSLEHEAVKRSIAEHLSAYLGRPEEWALQFVAAGGGRAVGNGGRSVANPAGRVKLPEKEEIFKDESIRFISDRFGGRVTEIRPRR